MRKLALLSIAVLVLVEAGICYGIGFERGQRAAKINPQEVKLAQLDAEECKNSQLTTARKPAERFESSFDSPNSEAASTTTRPQSLTKAGPTGGTPEIVHARAAASVRELYTPILPVLGLTLQQQEDLLHFLAVARVANTTAGHFQGERLPEEERSLGIAAIIGYQKMSLFNDFEGKLRENYAVQRIASVLAITSEPLTQEQRRHFVQLLVQERDTQTDPTGTTIGSNSYERRILHGAAQFLTPLQLTSLREQLAVSAASRTSLRDLY